MPDCNNNAWSELFFKKQESDAIIQAVSKVGFSKHLVRRAFLWVFFTDSFMLSTVILKHHPIQAFYQFQIQLDRCDDRFGKL